MPRKGPLPKTSKSDKSTAATCLSALSIRPNVAVQPVGTSAQEFRGHDPVQLVSATSGCACRGGHAEMQEHKPSNSTQASYADKPENTARTLPQALQSVPVSSRRLAALSRTKTFLRPSLFTWTAHAAAPRAAHRPAAPLYQNLPTCSNLTHDMRSVEESYLTSQMLPALATEPSPGLGPTRCSRS